MGLHSTMAQMRRESVRGRVARGDSSKKIPKRGPLPSPEPVSDPKKPRNVVDYGLSRAADITNLHRGGALSSDFCEADPYLLKAAKFHGEKATGNCPACKGKKLVELNYIYGDELGPYAGRIRKASELPGMCNKFGEFHVYVVEVCPDCHWNYLLRKFSLGDGTPRRAVPSIPAEDLLD